MKTTLVTFFFNIKDLPDANDSVRPQSFYMEHGHKTLALPYPMVIFCDTITYDNIKGIRGELPTKYIIKSLMDYDFFSYNIETIRKNREGNLVYLNNRNTPSYFILTMFKVIAIKIAYQQNPFNTPYYAWIDFAGARVLKDFDKSMATIVADPNPKVSFCYIEFRSKAELASMESPFIWEGKCGVVSGCFSVQKEYVDKFYNGTMSIFHEMLVRGVGHAEEQVFTHFWNRNPELCTIFYGDYPSILINYKYPTQDFHLIRWLFIERAINAERKDIALECIESLLKSYKLSEEEKSVLDSLKIKASVR
jgi:hypothetical protein